MDAACGEPADAYKLAYTSYLLLGMGLLFPWGAFLTAADYFEAQYPGQHADRLFTICYLPINLLVLTLLVRWHSRLRPVVRVVGGFSGFTLAVAAVPLLDMAGPGDAAFRLTLALVALCGVCDGLAQGALFGDAAALPPRFTQALISGTGASGVAVCLLRVVTKATLPGTPEGLRASANIYFALASLVCAGCVVLYGAVVPRLPLIRFYRQAALAAALAEAEAWGPDGAHKPGEPGGSGSGGAGRWQELHGEGLEEEAEQLTKAEGGDEVLGGASGRGSPRLSRRRAPRLWLSPLRSSGGSRAGGGDSRPASPERQLTDMVEAEPADAHTLHAAPAAGRPLRLSTDVELVAEDHQQQYQPQYHLPGTASESPIQQQLLSDSIFSVYSEAEPGGPHPHGNGNGGNGARPAAGGGGQPDYGGVLRLLWRFAAANVAIYTVTLSIFPGVLAEDVSSAELGSWYPVILISLFNLADWAGKSAPGLPALRLHNERLLLGLALLRLAFVPAFHFAATGGAGPGVIGLLAVLLGLSNGWLTSCAMIGAPQRVAASAAALAGNLMVLSLILGLCVGAFCGFLWLL